MSRLALGLGLALLFVEASVAGVLVTTSDRVTDKGWTLFLVIALVAGAPIAFFFGILHTRLARSSVAEVALALQAGRPLRDSLATALRDPSVDVVYRLDRSRGLGGAAWGTPRGAPWPIRPRMPGAGSS